MLTFSGPSGRASLSICIYDKHYSFDFLLLVYEIVENVGEGRKITAIKIVRAVSSTFRMVSSPDMAYGLGLKESKDLVDFVIDNITLLRSLKATIIAHNFDEKERRQKEADVVPFNPFS
ncbi:MAG: hypothetical protein WC302_03320 [Candidatus Paceibacterota bacterium]|jgi:hypothetical protein